MNNSPSRASIIPDHRLPLIFGHRGASGYTVDNTITSFNLAIDQGADGLESDIYLTKEGTPFLFHDSTCFLQNNPQKVKTRTLHDSDLEKIVLPNDETVPTLENFLKLYAGKTAKTGKPLRFSFDYQLGSGEPAARLIKKYGCEDQTEFCAKVGLMFQNVRKISSEIHIIASNSIRIFTPRTLGKSYSKYQKYGIESFNIKAADFREDFLSFLLPNGFDFYIWDLHDEARLRKYLTYRPKAVYSNYPDLAIKIRTELFGEKNE